MNSSEFLALWRAWDRHPGYEDTAGAFEDACQMMAAQLEMGATPLRIQFAALRRDGLDRETALRSVHKPGGDTCPIVV